ncbi:MAG: cytochrome c biogenesis CcdA family protein [Candidatus Paceibacteria bacterium]
MIETGLIISAFIAGVLMFLAPCTLPLLPAYLGFISGASLEDLKDPEKAKGVKRKIFLNGVFFVLGFSLIFIFFGTLAGFLGQGLAPFRVWFGRIGGALVILFGLFMLGVFRLPALQMDARLKLPSFLKVGRPSSSFVIGSAFAFGWTPCVGPILASILLLASTSSTALQGAFLLAVFSLGLAIPFITVAALISSATGWIEKSAKYLNVVSIIGGIFLIGLGVLLITDNFGLTIQYGYQLFEFIEYDRLLDYL